MDVVGLLLNVGVIVCAVAGVAVARWERRTGKSKMTDGQLRVFTACGIAVVVLAVVNLLTRV